MKQLFLSTFALRSLATLLNCFNTLTYLEDMLKLQLDNKYALFLDHRELINSAYCENIEDASETYEIKPALFYFHSRDTLDIADQIRRKQKRKIKVIDDVCAQFDESINYSDRIETYLTLLRAEVDFSRKESSKVLARYWEEAYTLPQLNGGNSTNTIQKFQLNSTSPMYLIPAFSRFYNFDIQHIQTLLPELPKYDIIVMDPPWRNKYIRRLNNKKLAYKMLDNEYLKQIPISELIHEDSIVAVWCTNSLQHQKALVENILPSWKLRLLHTCRWYKLNTAGELICPINNELGQKKPYEMLYLARHINCSENFATAVRNVELLLSVCSIIHSHKPPLLQWLRQEVRQPSKCLELFARYLHPDCTSIGLEVLKLMDTRLYNLKNH